MKKVLFFLAAAIVAVCTLSSCGKLDGTKEITVRFYTSNDMATGTNIQFFVANGSTVTPLSPAASSYNSAVDEPLVGNIGSTCTVSSVQNAMKFYECTVKIVPGQKYDFYMNFTRNITPMNANLLSIAAVKIINGSEVIDSQYHAARVARTNFVQSYFDMNCNNKVATIQ